jgi:uncharacterized membrane protein
VAVVVGFGTVALNGLYVAAAKRRGGTEAAAIHDATYSVSKIAEYFIYAVPLLGIALIILSDEVWEFSQSWISISFLLYIVGLGVSHGLLWPNYRRLNTLVREAAMSGGGSASVAEMEAADKKVALAGTLLNIIVVVIIALMIWKPGL